MTEKEIAAGIANDPAVTPADDPQLLASRRHTLVLLTIVAVMTLAGVLQASRQEAASSSASRVPAYLVTIGLQALWVRYVHIGMKRRGRSVADLVGGRPNGASLAMDLLYGALGLLVCYAGVAGVRLLFDLLAVPGHAKIGFLLPRGGVESALWVVVSIAAGVCEEIVFRGYLQRQFAALAGSVPAAIVLQAAIFGALHGYQGLTSTALAATIGLVLGVLAWWRGDVRAGMAAHAAWDIMGGLMR